MPKEKLPLNRHYSEKGEHAKSSSFWKQERRDQRRKTKRKSLNPHGAIWTWEPPSRLTGADVLNIELGNEGY